MQVTVRLFALARQRAGRPEIVVDLEGPATVGALRSVLGAAYPELAAMIPSLMFAVENEYATDDTPIAPGAEVAAIPPVSGGTSFAKG